MEEFQKTYTVASIYRGIFMKAVQLLFPDYARNTGISNPVTDAIVSPIATDSTTRDTSVFNEPVIDSAITDSLVDALIDEASMFNFWESLDRI
jgi:hypothetical protein